MLRRRRHWCNVKKFEEKYLNHLYIYAEGEQRGVSEEESMAGDGAKRATDNSSSQPFRYQS